MFSRTIHHLILLAALLVMGLSLSACYTTAQVLFVQGQKEFQVGNYQGAAEKFQEAIQLDPKNTTIVRYWLGKALYELGDYKGTATAFREFLRLTQSDPGRYADERWDAMFYLEKSLKALGEELTEEDRKQKEIIQKHPVGWGGETGGMMRD